MEALVPVLMVLAVGGMFVGFLASIFFFSYLYMKYEGGKWLKAAERLGLAIEPSRRYGSAPVLFGRPYYMDELVGTRGGLHVRIGTRVVVTGSGKNRSQTFYTYASVELGRSLDLGLGLAPTHVVSRIWGSLVGEHDLQLGDPSLDPTYSIQAAEPDLARRLLMTPHVAEALRYLGGASFRPYVDDQHLRCERRGKTFDPGTLGIALDQAVDLAHRLLSARAMIGPSTAEHVIATEWRRVAEARSLTLDPAGLRMFGRYEGMHVEVDTSLREERRWTTFTVRFDRTLGLGLQLTRQGGLSGLGKLFGMQDIVLGDPVFDERFVVKGAPEQRVREVLTPEVRARLVDLQSQATTLAVADDHLCADVSWLVADAASVESAIASVAAAGAALAQVSAPGAGPFRG